MNLFSRVWKQLHDPEYRRCYMEGYTSMLVPFQIRALRKARDWTQAELGRRAGFSRRRISELEEAGSEPRSLKTLYKIARAFDVGVLVEFVPYSQLVSREQTFHPSLFDVPSFPNDRFTDESVFMLDVLDTMERDIEVTKKFLIRDPAPVDWSNLFSTAFLTGRKIPDPVDDGIYLFPGYNLYQGLPGWAPKEKPHAISD